MLSFFTRIFVQDEESLRLLEGIGVHHAERVGDTRFDRVREIAAAAHPIPVVERFAGDEPVMVCGSTWPEDETLLLDYMNRHPAARKWVVVPHEIGEGHVREILGKARVPAVRYTDTAADWQVARILVIDQIGFLSSVYRYATMAYIGGGFGRGIHNTLEAAVYGIPVIFGPRHRKFHEAVELLAHGGAFTIKNGEELDSVLDSLIENPAIARAAGQEALAYVRSQLGATDVIIRHLLKD